MIPHPMRFATLVCLVLFVSSCAAQEKPQPAGSHLLPEPSGTNYLSAAPPASEAQAMPKLPSPAPLMVIPGDLLHITVFRQKDLELEVRVPESGTFAYPLINEVQATGRNIKQVESDIRRRLEEKYLRNAGVTVTVKEFAPRSVFILGGVQKPGGYEIRPNGHLTILQLISTAGGYTDRACKEFAHLVRRKTNDERELVRFSATELERAVARGQVDADLELAPDDLVVIPSAARVAYVLGQVNKPGSVELPMDTRITVSMAVSQAGSWTKFASITNIQILRQSPSGDPARLSVNLDAVVSGKLDQDVELRPGDVIMVPQRSLF